MPAATTRLLAALLLLAGAMPASATTTTSQSPWLPRSVERDLLKPLDGPPRTWKHHHPELPPRPKTPLPCPVSLQWMPENEHLKPDRCPCCRPNRRYLHSH